MDETAGEQYREDVVQFVKFQSAQLESVACSEIFVKMVEEVIKQYPVT